MFASGIERAETNTVSNLVEAAKQYSERPLNVTNLFGELILSVAAINTAKFNWESGESVEVARNAASEAAKKFDNLAPDHEFVNAYFAGDKGAEEPETAKRILDQVSRLAGKPVGNFLYDQMVKRRGLDEANHWLNEFTNSGPESRFSHELSACRIHPKGTV